MRRFFENIGHSQVKFCSGGAEAVEKVKNGSDTNIIPSSIPKQMQQSCPSLEFKKFSGPVYYSTIVKNGPKVICQKPSQV